MIGSWFGRTVSQIETETRLKTFLEGSREEFSAMGESLTEQYRVGDWRITVCKPLFLRIKVDQFLLD